MTEDSGPEDVYAQLARIRASLSGVQERASAALEQNRRALEQLTEARQRRAQGARQQRYVPESVVIELTEQVAALQRQVEGLRTAMEHRAVIEQAKGVLMARDTCDAETAFRTLVATSQRSNRKLREVAQMVVSWVVPKGSG